MSEKQTTYQHTQKLECLRNIARQTSDLYLVHCGFQACAPGYTYNHKVPNEFHLHFVLKGKGWMTINDQKYEIQKNDLFLIPRMSELELAQFSYGADEDDPWEYAWVTFDGDKAAQYLARVGLTLECPVVSSLAPTQNYMELIHAILKTSKLTYANELRRVSYLYELLAQLIEAQSTSETSPKGVDYSNEVYIEYACQYIRHNYASIKVADVANYIGLSRSYFTAMFKSELHLSPQEYIIKVRLQKASECLLASNETTQQIAQKVGYSDSYAFSKAFKLLYGKSPNTYRKEQG